MRSIEPGKCNAKKRPDTRSHSSGRGSESAAARRIATASDRRRGPDFDARTAPATCLLPDRSSITLSELEHPAIRRANDAAGGSWSRNRLHSHLGLKLCLTLYLLRIEPRASNAFRLHFPYRHKRTTRPHLDHVTNVEVLLIGHSSTFALPKIVKQPVALSALR